MSGLFAHRYCLNDDPILIGFTAVSNLLITLAYYSIPVTLFALVRNKIIGAIVGRWLFSMFGVFILLCGTTHLMDVVVIWVPAYRLQTCITLLTSAASIITAIALVPVTLKLLARGDAQERFEFHRAVETTSNLSRLKELVRERS